MRGKEDARWGRFGRFFSRHIRRATLVRLTKNEFKQSGAGREFPCESFLGEALLPTVLMLSVLRSPAPCGDPFESGFA